MLYRVEIDAHEHALLCDLPTSDDPAFLQNTGMSAVRHQARFVGFDDDVLEIAEYRRAWREGMPVIDDPISMIR